MATVAGCNWRLGALRSEAKILGLSWRNSPAFQVQAASAILQRDVNVFGYSKLDTSEMCEVGARGLAFTRSTLLQRHLELGGASYRRSLKSMLEDSSDWLGQAGLDLGTHIVTAGNSARHRRWVRAGGSVRSERVQAVSIFDALNLDRGSAEVPFVGGNCDSQSDEEAQHTDSSEYDYACEVCGRLFNSMMEAEMHEATCTSAVEEPTSDSDVYECSVCARQFDCLLVAEEHEAICIKSGLRYVAAVTSIQKAWRKFRDQKDEAIVRRQMGALRRPTLDDLRVLPTVVDHDVTAAYVEALALTIRNRYRAAFSCDKWKDVRDSDDEDDTEFRRRGVNPQEIALARYLGLSADDWCDGDDGLPDPRVDDWLGDNDSEDENA